MNRLRCHKRHLKRHLWPSHIKLNCYVRNHKDNCVSDNLITRKITLTSEGDWNTFSYEFKWNLGNRILKYKNEETYKRFQRRSQCLSYVGIRFWQGFGCLESTAVNPAKAALSKREEANQKMHHAYFFCHIFLSIVYGKHTANHWCCAKRSITNCSSERPARQDQANTLAQRAIVCYSDSFHAVLAWSCWQAKYQCCTATVTVVIYTPPKWSSQGTLVQNEIVSFKNY